MAGVSKYSKLPGDGILSMLEGPGGRPSLAQLEGPLEGKNGEEKFPGEYVLNRNVVDAVGTPMLDFLNYEAFPRFKDSKSKARGTLLGEHLGLAEDIPKLQSGGQTLTQGSGTTALPLLSDIYKQMGIQPVEEQMGQFQEYDASREDVLFGDYARQVAAERAAGQQGMSAAYQASLGMGKGFSGFGGREQGMGQARQSILKDFLSQKAGAQSTLFKQVRGEREAYMTDIASQMRALQGEGGTEEFGAGATEATYTAPSETTGQATPPGWPTANAYDQWRQSGSDPNTATNYGWQAVNPGDTPGYK